ncbi:hypothetical protein [Xanthomonas translucens]|uniref:hypothetical protein n=1 Tax=Xanthomonas campestris pv. translucens TaxID=343 RepID=UPI00071BB401|nr:hypothetical protein [Xanthomonas translucens]AVY67185.1 hypothetical protein NZ30_12895 [Xanthomonas translucens pv. undulosa]MCT8281779.1 hypothetical protein [Xanthomonas translucens pv. undulosa]MCT8316467.1 hypothetical protein [Xanthomonas translucens pv. undulosa]UKE38293.1 hypothetical protein KCU58_10995 [Xanthomonas translucens pv. undulosa]
MKDSSIRQFSLVPYALVLLVVGGLVAALTWPVWGVVPEWMKEPTWPAWLQAVGSLFAIVVAIAVPARLASFDRRARAAEAIVRARSFALQHYRAMEVLGERLHANRSSNPAGQPVADQNMLASVEAAFAQCRIPSADLYLLGAAALPVQRAFALAAQSASMADRRGAAAQRGDDIVAYDQRRNQLFLDAADAMDDGLAAIAKLLH